MAWWIALVSLRGEHDWLPYLVSDVPGSWNRPGYADLLSAHSWRSRQRFNVLSYFFWKWTPHLGIRFWNVLNFFWSMKRTISSQPLPSFTSKQRQTLGRAVARLMARRWHRLRTGSWRSPKLRRRIWICAWTNLADAMEDVVWSLLISEVNHVNPIFVMPHETLYLWNLGGSNQSLVWVAQIVWTQRGMLEMLRFNAVLALRVS